MNYIEKLNSEQTEILNLMISGENIFLTGEAGTGKSFTINAYDQYCTGNIQFIIYCYIYVHGGCTDGVSGTLWCSNSGSIYVLD